MPPTLNPKLYGALVKLFDDVKINKPEAPFQYSLVKGETEVMDSGEDYSVKCPVCNDHSHRLHFGHMWGETVNNARAWFLAHCFNEECQSTTEFSKLVVEPLLSTMKGLKVPKARKARPPAEYVQKYVSMPRSILSLKALPDNHHILKYLNGRGFNIKELDKNWGIRWAPHGSFTDESCKRTIPINHGLVMPMQSRDGLVAYQTRFVNPVDLSDKPTGNYPPKYFTVGAKGSYLYNLHRVKGPFVILVEGPFDAWNIGKDMAISSWGKSITTIQQDLLYKLLSKTGLPFIVWLDEDAEKNSDKICDWCREHLKNKIIQISNPQDPGKMTRKEIVEVIKENVRK